MRLGQRARGKTAWTLLAVLGVIRVACFIQWEICMSDLARQGGARDGKEHVVGFFAGATAFLFLSKAAELWSSQVGEARRQTRFSRKMERREATMTVWFVVCTYIAEFQAIGFCFFMLQAGVAWVVNPWWGVVGVYTVAIKATRLCSIVGAAGILPMWVVGEICRDLWSQGNFAADWRKREEEEEAKITLEEVMRDIVRSEMCGKKEIEIESWKDARKKHKLYHTFNKIMNKWSRSNDNLKVQFAEQMLQQRWAKQFVRQTEQQMRKSYAGRDASMTDCIASLVGLDIVEESRRVWGKRLIALASKRNRNTASCRTKVRIHALLLLGGGIL